MSAESPARRSSASSSGDRGTARVLAENDEDVECRLLDRDALILQSEQEPFDPGPESDARRRRTADRLDEAVVTTASTDRGVRAPGRPDEFECRSGVVVETAHERRRQHVRNVECIELLPGQQRSARGRRRTATRRSSARRRAPLALARPSRRTPAAGSSRACGARRRPARRRSHRAIRSVARHTAGGRRRHRSS